MSTGERNTWRRAISRIWTKLGWFDPPMGRVHQPKNFWSGGTPCGRGSPTPGPILLVNSKSCLTASTAFLLCMVNFFDDNKKMGKKFFWTGPNCRIFTLWANSGLIAYAIAKPTRHGLVTPKRKFSYILVNRLMGNFQFRGCRINF